MTRRFIAGAVCPQCREIDRLVVERDEQDGERRTCVACGFSDDLPQASAPVPRGRPERPKRRDDSVQVVQLRDFAPAAPRKDP